MKPILVVASSERLAELKTQLSDHFAADFLNVGDLSHRDPHDVTVLDFDLRDADALKTVKKWLQARLDDCQIVAAINDRTSRLEVAQACAIGATSMLERPLTADKLRRTLFRGADVIALAPVELPEEALDPSPEISGLHNVFSAAAAGRAPDLKATSVAAAQMVDKIAEIGLGRYLKIVRNHHNQTYQHCLSVTAIAIAFARELGFNRTDIEKVALAGLLHDVGKALVPTAILEKPGELTRDENVLMRMHPEMRYQLLRNLPGLSEDILDMVLHHHEYLDGSGYPHALKGAQISDLARLITIADVYGALIERRSYKPALSTAQAYRVLQTMESKLDAALVREFLPLSRH